jgi:hypothetical protein
MAATSAGLAFGHFACEASSGRKSCGGIVEGVCAVERVTVQQQGERKDANRLTPLWEIDTVPWTI